VAAVAEVAAADVVPTSHPLPLTNVTRPDVVSASLPREEVLAAAPEAEDGRFRVPQILEDEA
jgi:aspartyl-tRNA(Asn)/glutamyl-tRNA(Gln) amidotransferase subunit C